MREGKTLKMVMVGFPGPDPAEGGFSGGCLLNLILLHNNPPREDVCSAVFMSGLMIFQMLRAAALRCQVRLITISGARTQRSRGHGKSLLGWKIGIQLYMGKVQRCYVRWLGCWTHVRAHFPLLVLSIQSPDIPAAKRRTLLHCIR